MPRRHRRRRRQAADPTAQVWVTTPDGARKLAAETVPFTGTVQPVDIRVDAGNRGQRFTGAGASVTEASAHLVQGLPADKRAELMKSLFSPSEGIGLNYLRQPLGSTDFNSGGFSTYEDTKGSFSLARDQQEIIPVLKQATALNPAIRFMGSPWSPPAWMKTGNSLNGGSLRADQYQAYADYLVKAIKAYGQQGITLTDLTVQNEPEFATSYPSTSMTAAEQAAFLKVLDRTLTAAGLPTNVLAYDHNWDHPNYPLEVFASTQGIQRVIGAAFHCYGGQPSAQQQVVDAGKRVFFTECSGTDSANPATTFADTLRWHAENLVVQNMRNGGETVVTWNLALDRNGGPHQGHCADRCNGVVEIANGDVTRNAEYYVLGHVTKFVKPGATRIGSTSQGAGGVQNVAFQNPDGSFAAYVVNTASSDRRFSLTEGGRSSPTPSRPAPWRPSSGPAAAAPRRSDRPGRLVPRRRRPQRRLPGRRRLGHGRRDRPPAVELRHGRQPEVAVPSHERRPLPGRQPVQLPRLGRRRRFRRHRRRCQGPPVELRGRHQPAVAARGRRHRRPVPLRRPPQRQVPRRRQRLDRRRSPAVPAALRRFGRPDVHPDGLIPGTAAPFRRSPLLPSSGTGRGENLSLWGGPRRCRGGTGMNAWVVPGYTETRELGAGAGGRVVLAVHDATGTPVAVKYLGSGSVRTGRSSTASAPRPGCSAPLTARTSSGSTSTSRRRRARPS